MEEKLQEVFRDVFGDDDLVIGRNTTAVDVEGWDSMAHINLIVAIEKRFGVKFTARELASTREGDGNVGKLLDLLATKAS
jgi:acyl carrier protein